MQNDNVPARKDDGLDGKGNPKLRFDLLPVNPLRTLAEVYTIGARKYSDRNWEKGLKWGRVYGAMLRHATAWWGGERLDPEDKQHHLASVAWCALTLLEYERTHPELDDRPTTYVHNFIPTVFLSAQQADNEEEKAFTEMMEDIGKFKQGTDPDDNDDTTNWAGGV